jgi:hypothetical protein
MSARMFSVYTDQGVRRILIVKYFHSAKFYKK